MTAIKKEPRCKRLGMCCYLVNREGIPTGKHCPNLIKLKSGNTLCRIYRTRLGKKIGTIDGLDNYCAMRNQSKVDFEGCEYNDGKKDVYGWREGKLVKI